MGYSPWRAERHPPPAARSEVAAPYSAPPKPEQRDNWTPIPPAQITAAADATRQAIETISGLSYENGVSLARVVESLCIVIGGGGGGAVSSVFGRMGAVTAQVGDYSASQVTNAVDSSMVYSNPAWIGTLAWSKLTGVPALVTSAFGRTGAVAAMSGDYTAAQVTNAVDSSQVYNNPTWIGTLAYSKLTGAPSISSNQTPWLQDINAAGFRLLNAGNVGVGTTNPTATIHSANSTGGYQYKLERSGATDPHVYGIAVSGVPGQPNLVIDDITASINRLTISSTGYVGIGTASPAESLDVASGGMAIRGASGSTAQNFMKLDFASFMGRVIVFGGAGSGGQFQVKSLWGDGSNVFTGINVQPGSGSVWVGLKCPTSSFDTTLVENSMFYVFINESTNALTFRVKYSTGTIKQGTITVA